MRFPSKELIIAIIVGFLIGLVIMYGVWTANQTIKRKQSSLSPVPTVTISDNIKEVKGDNEVNSEVKLNLAQPEAYALINTEMLTISGTATAGTNLFIYGEKNSALVIADASGQFSASLQLIKGVNYITVTAIMDDGTQTTENRTLVYSTAEI